MRFARLLFVYAVLLLQIAISCGGRTLHLATCRSASCHEPDCAAGAACRSATFCSGDHRHEGQTGRELCRRHSRRTGETAAGASSCEASPSRNDATCRSADEPRRVDCGQRLVAAAVHRQAALHGESLQQRHSPHSALTCWTCRLLSLAQSPAAELACLPFAPAWAFFAGMQCSLSSAAATLGFFSRGPPLG